MMDYENAKAGNVTLEFPMALGVSGDTLTVGDVMDIRGCGKTGAMCYEYDEVYTLQA
jgi:tyrosinase